MKEKCKKYYQVPRDKQHQMINCIEEEPKNWTFTLDQLDSILTDLNSKLSMIDVSKVELQRLEALLSKAGLEGEDGKSALEVYEDALGVSQTGYKVIHKRDIDEIRVNYYNAEWLLNWNANIDIQICFDFYAVITYISDYYSKDDSGTMGHIMQALKNADNESLKQKMSIVVHTFLTHR